MKFYEISEEVLNALIAYLSGRPYNEVHQGMNSLHSLLPIDEHVSAVSPVVEPVASAV